MNILHRAGTATRASSAFADIHIDDSLPWEPNLDERIMVIAPHPDDEVLAAGGVIATALKFRNQIRVIVATNGDASYATALSHGSHLITKENFRRLAIMRQRESLNALVSLGLNAEQVRFWGFPDRGLSSLWKNHWDSQHPYRSSTTSYNNSVQALNSPVLPFTRASLDELFTKELSEFHPTTMIMPHPQDNHSDHSALAGFTLFAARQYPAQARHSPPVLLAYWMWAESKPWLTGARPQDLAHLLIPQDSATIVDRHLTLSPEIREQKARALRFYPSQNIAAGKIFRKVSRSMHENFTLLQSVS